MASGLSSVTVRIDGQIKGFQEKLDQASKSLTRTARNMQRAATLLTPALTFPLVGLGTAALRASADLEKLENALAVSIGSTAEASRLMRRFAEDAKAPGVGFEQLTRGVVKLRAVGFETEQARQTLLTFGNALALAGGRATDLDGVQLALGQIISKGKISAEEINQLAERVPQVRTAIESAFGTADSEALQRLGVGVEEFVAKTTAELAKLPPATAGLQEGFETFGVAVRGAFGELGTTINETFGLQEALVSIAEAITKTIRAFSGLPTPIKRFTIGIAAAAAALGPLLGVVGGLILVRAQLTAWLSAAIGGLKGVAATALTASPAVKGVGVSMVRMGQSAATARVAVTALNAAMRAATGLVFALAVTTAIQALTTYIDRAGKAKQVTESFANVSDAVTAATAGQVSRVDALVAAYGRADATLQDQTEALRGLKEVNADVFGQFTAGVTTYERLTAAASSFTAELERQAKVSAISDEVSRLFTERIALERELNELGERLAAAPTRIDRGKTGFADAGTVTRPIQREIDATEAAIAGLDEAIAELGQRSADLIPPEVADAVVEVAGESVGAATATRELARAFDLLPARSQGFVESLDNVSAALARTQRLSDQATLGSIVGDLRGDLEDAGRLTEFLGEDDVQALDRRIDAYLAAVKRLATDTSLSNYYEKELADLQAQRQVLVERKANTDKAIADAEEARKRIESNAQALGSVLSQTAQQLVEGLSELVVGLASGSLSGTQALGKLLEVLGSGAQQFGALIITFGGAMEAFQKSLASLTGVPALVAGGLLIAAGAAVRSYAKTLQKPPALAEGGLAFGPTLAIVGDNPGAKSDPEVISPLSKLKEFIGENNRSAAVIGGEFRVRGTDLVLALERASTRNRPF